MSLPPRGAGPQSGCLRTVLASGRRQEEIPLGVLLAGDRMGELDPEAAKDEHEDEETEPPKPRPRRRTARDKNSPRMSWDEALTKARSLTADWSYEHLDAERIRKAVGCSQDRSRQVEDVLRTEREEQALPDPDKEVGLACVRAYNDWMVEEWCGDSGGRPIPLCLIPPWDVTLAVAEIRRNAARGVRAVTFSEIPTYLGLPSIHSGYWDPFFAACEKTGTVVNMHIGSSSQMPAASPDAPPAVQAALSFNNAMASMAMDFLFSGVLVKFPRLKLAYSEGQMGWIPYALERADDVWEEHRAWGGVKNLIPEPPSTYYYRQIFCCFFRDKHGIEAIETVGVDNATFETDYPHVDSTWPHTKQVAADHVAGLPDDVTYKLLRGNAIRMLDLPFDGNTTASR
ncbi:amidohydrolase family protein [Streptomyces sp. NPDC013457]|uniref:amidohydrolase family protein n=1 Tax=Streptomyces sp. NPDC013457 TaxID=3364866 RepID=UPI0037016100